MSNKNSDNLVFIQTVFDSNNKSLPFMVQRGSPKNKNVVPDKTREVLPSQQLLSQETLMHEDGGAASSISQAECLSEPCNSGRSPRVHKQKKRKDLSIGQQRVRVIAACDRCKRRKKKCNGLEPCSNCKKSSNECTYLRLSSRGVHLQYREGFDQNSERNLITGATITKSDPKSFATEYEIQNYGVDFRHNDEALSDGETPGSDPKLHLEDIEQKMEGLQEEIKELKRNLNEHKNNRSTPNIPVNGYSMPNAKSSNAPPRFNEFYRSVWLLLRDNNGESVAGPTAIISKVNFIKNWIASKIYNEVQSNTHPPPEHDAYIRGIDQDGFKINIPPSSDIKLEKTYLDYYYSLMSQRYYFIEKSCIEKLFAEYVDTHGKFDPTSKSGEFRDIAHKRTVMFLVLAVGCRLLKLSKSVSVLTPELYFDKAIDSLSEISFELNLIDQIRLIMLIALYSLHSYNRNIKFMMNIWELSGLAIRKMTQVGLHRFVIPTLKNSREYEMKKRLFWSVYSFEKILCLTLGRPASISDDEIDVPYPLNIDSLDSSTDEKLFSLQKEQQTLQYKKQNHRILYPRKVFLTYYLIQLCQVREIEARISRLERMVSIPIDPKNVRAEVDISAKYMSEFNQIAQDLEDWKREFPSPQEFNEGMKNQIHFEYLVMCYHRAKVFLYLSRIMQKQIKEDETNSVFCEICEAAGGVCKSYMVMSKGEIFGYSMFTLHTLFLVGMLLAYCILNLEGSTEQTSKTATELLQGSSVWRFHNYLRQCSVLLTSFAERTKKAASFRVLFDKLLEDGSFSKEVQKPQHDKRTSNTSTDAQDCIHSSYSKQTYDLSFNGTFDKNPEKTNSRSAAPTSADDPWAEKSSHNTMVESMYDFATENARMEDHYGLRDFMNIFSDASQMTFSVGEQTELNAGGESDSCERYGRAGFYID